VRDLESLQGTALIPVGKIKTPKGKMVGPRLQSLGRGL
jgi:hypothetical protein